MCGIIVHRRFMIKTFKTRIIFVFVFVYVALTLNIHVLSPRHLADNWTADSLTDLCQMEGQGNNLFELDTDRFSCVHINTNVLPAMTCAELETKLPASLSRWQDEGVRGVWSKVGIKHSELVPVFVKNGFEFHHAQPKYVMLKKWISSQEEDMLPPYANQYLGAGGFVINEQNELLVIQEKFHDKPHWKLPGGHAEPGEEIGEAAQREVLEETGVRTEFVCVICFRHMHKYRHGCSDFYFICLLRPLSADLRKCDREIAAVRWIPLDDYIASPDVSAANRHFAECYRAMVKEGRYQLRPTEVLNYAKTGHNLVYSITDTGGEGHTEGSDT